MENVKRMFNLTDNGSINTINQKNRCLIATRETGNCHFIWVTPPLHLPVCTSLEFFCSGLKKYIFKKSHLSNFIFLEIEAIAWLITGNFYRLHPPNERVHKIFGKNGPALNCWKPDYSFGDNQRLASPKIYLSDCN